MNFKDQIKSPKWQKKRLEILERDEFTCQMCKSKDKTLHVHHKFYTKNKKIWEYENKDLITLCEGCHKEVTRAKESIVNNMRFLILNIYIARELSRFIYNLGVYEKESQDEDKHIIILNYLKIFNSLIFSKNSENINYITK